MSMSMFRPLACTAIRSFATAAASVAPQRFLVAVGASDLKGSIEAAKKAVTLAKSGWFAFLLILVLEEYIFAS